MLSRLTVHAYHNCSLDGDPSPIIWINRRNAEMEIGSGFASAQDNAGGSSEQACDAIHEK